MIFQKYGSMKLVYRNWEFWCKGYYVDTVGKDAKKIAEYIKHQLEEDKMRDRIPLPGDPFTGSK